MFAILKRLLFWKSDPIYKCVTVYVDNDNNLIIVPISEFRAIDCIFELRAPYTDGELEESIVKGLQLWGSMAPSNRDEQSPLERYLGVNKFSKASKGRKFIYIKWLKKDGYYVFPSEKENGNSYELSKETALGREFQAGELAKAFKQAVADSTTDSSSAVKRDGPVSFGYKMGWLAVKNADPKVLADAIKVKYQKKASWEKGIEKVYEDEQMVFISPIVEGWTFVVGSWALGPGEIDGINNLAKTISDLSNIFEEVQAFGTHRITEYHHWIRSVSGISERQFAFLGESGEVLCNIGEHTEAEEKLNWSGLENFSWSPDETDVMHIAGSWSLNPTTLESKRSEKYGILGRI